MFGRIFRRDRESDTIAATLYGAIVAQARQPALYRDLEVADTVDGRFEMVVLHTVLVLDRLQSSARASAVAQRIFDLHCTDMDHSLREMGIGDLGVPKRMKTMTGRFYGRAAKYREALAATDTGALVDSLERNVYARETPAAAALAAYTVAAFQRLAATPETALLAGDISYPDPSAFSPVSA